MNVGNETTTQPDLVRIWERTAQAFDERLALLTEDMRSLPTPCAAWNVGELIEHAIGVQFRYAAMLGYDLTDPSWPAVREAFPAALANDDTLSTDTFQHSVLAGMPKLMGLGVAINDLLVHTWDLSRAAGLDEVLPADAVAACLTLVHQLPEHAVRSPGVWGPVTAVAEGADGQQQLLAFVGRTP